MFVKAATSRRAFLTGGRLACWTALLAVTALSWLACEDNGLGRPCDLNVDATALQGAYTTQATDCPSRICIKPAVQPGVSSDLDTGAYCSATCASDSDCEGQTRDQNNKKDTRCKRGYQCAPVFGEGSLCCKKLCLCKDFVAPTVGPVIPDACKSESGVSCK